MNYSVQLPWAAMKITWLYAYQYILKKGSSFINLKEIKEEETLCLCSVNAYHFHLAERREMEQEAYSSSKNSTVNTFIEMQFKRDT